MVLLEHIPYAPSTFLVPIKYNLIKLKVYLKVNMSEYMVVYCQYTKVQLKGVPLQYGKIYLLQLKFHFCTTYVQLKCIKYKKSVQIQYNLKYTYFQSGSKYTLIYLSMLKCSILKYTYFSPGTTKPLLCQIKRITLPAQL